MSNLWRISFCTFLLGIFGYAYRTRLIIFRSPWPLATAGHSLKSYKKTVKIWHYTKERFSFEVQQILWDDNEPAANISRLINAYFTFLDEEGLLDSKIQLESSSLSSKNTELLISFMATPFHAEMSTHQKWMLIEGILLIVRENISPVQSVRFLLNHQPLTDHHLDFSFAWPIEGFLPTKNSPPVTASPCSGSPTITTMMLEPAGDAQYTGRIIEDSFERGIALQFAQELKKSLEFLNKKIRVILSRFPGEVLEPLQNATFANRLKTDVYLTISTYQTSTPLPEISIYYFLSHPTTNFWQKKKAPLSLEPYSQAHLQNSVISRNIAQSLFNTLQGTKPLAAHVKQCAGLPVKPLIGITSPALIIECGLDHKNSWQQLVAPLTQHIYYILSSLPPQQS